MGAAPSTGADVRGDVRAKVIAVATRLFAERGVRATSLQAIAADVGIRKQSVLHYFPSKEALRRVVLDQVLAHWNEVLPRVFLAGGDGVERMEAILRTVMEFFRADIDRARIIIREILDRPAEMRKSLGENSVLWIRMISDAIRDGQSEGVVWEDVDPEAFIAQTAILICSGIGQMRVIDVMVRPDGGASAVDAAVDTAVDAYIEEVIRGARHRLFKPRTLYGTLPDSAQDENDAGS